MRLWCCYVRLAVCPCWEQEVKMEVLAEPSGDRFQVTLLPVKQSIL